MTKTQFRDALERLGLTQGQAAELLGLAIRTVHGYCNGVPIPKQTELAIKWLLQHGPPK
jgi:transcriptional regulator with XRE-family HTH domain